MAAFLTVDMLRAHAMPALPCNPHDPAARPRPAAEPRPVLAGRWIVASDGRLSCRWQTDVSDPFGPPPR